MFTTCFRPSSIHFATVVTSTVAPQDQKFVSTSVLLDRCSHGTTLYHTSAVPGACETVEAQNHVAFTAMFTGQPSPG